MLNGYWYFFSLCFTFKNVDHLFSKPFYFNSLVVDKNLPLLCFYIQDLEKYLPSLFFKFGPSNEPSSSFVMVSITSSIFVYPFVDSSSWPFVMKSLKWRIIGMKLLNCPILNMIWNCSIISRRVNWPIFKFCQKY